MLEKGGPHTLIYMQHECAGSRLGPAGLISPLSSWGWDSSSLRQGQGLWNK